MGNGNLLRWGILGFQAVGELLTNLLSFFVVGDLFVFDWIDIPASFVLAFLGQGGN